MYVPIVTFAVVVILHGIDDRLRGDDLIFYGNICLGRANNSAFLVFISILFFGEKVNTSDNITLAVYADKAY